MGQVITSVPSSKRVAKKERPQPKMKEAPSNEVAFLVSATPHREAVGGGVLRGYGYRQPEREGYRAASGGVVAESLERSYPWAVGFFFGNVELGLELWTVMSGISGFDN